VVIATPDGPATGFTPRHSRSLTAVTHPIIPDTYDKFGSSATDQQNRQLFSTRLKISIDKVWTTPTEG
jgi:hypothetical protein